MYGKTIDHKNLCTPYLWRYYLEYGEGPIPGKHVRPVLEDWTVESSTRKFSLKAPLEKAIVPTHPDSYSLLQRISLLARASLHRLFEWVYRPKGFTDSSVESVYSIYYYHFKK